jgi:hypothetical protein
LLALDLTSSSQRADPVGEVRSFVVAKSNLDSK